jgi:hypothetical protein
MSQWKLNAAPRGNEPGSRTRDDSRRTVPRHNPTDYDALSPVARAEESSVPLASSGPSWALPRRTFPRLPVSLLRRRLTRVVLLRQRTMAIRREREEQKVLLGRRQSFPAEACRRLLHNFRIQWAASTSERRRPGRHRPQGRFRLPLPS